MHVDCMITWLYQIVRTQQTCQMDEFNCMKLSVFNSIFLGAVSLNPDGLLLFLLKYTGSG